AHWWIPVSVLGWTLASALAGGADLLVRGASMRGWGALFAYLGLLAIGGLALGVVTGSWFARVGPREEAEAVTVTGTKSGHGPVRFRYRLNATPRSTSRRGAGKPATASYDLSSALATRRVRA